MASATSVQFPPGVIIARDAFVWITVPPELDLGHARILGTCSGDSLGLFLGQVTVDRGSWRRDLLGSGQLAPFPRDASFSLVIPAVNEIDQIAWSLSAVSTRITVHVCRPGVTGPPARWPAPTSFDLVLIVASADEVCS